MINVNERKINKENLLVYSENGIDYTTYPGEIILSPLIDLMKEELYEPYPVYTYRYFLNGWPDLCIIAFDGDKFIGGIVGKCDKGKTTGILKGYIAMIAVEKEYRGRKIGKNIARLFVERCQLLYKPTEIYLETEAINTGALALYESLGFVRTKIYLNYYSNGNSAYKLKLWFREEEKEIKITDLEPNNLKINNEETEASS